MSRVISLACVGWLVVVVVGCKKEAPPPLAGTVRFEVELPEFREYPEYEKPRRATLMVAGKEHIVPADKSGKSITVDHQPADDRATDVEIELSFWPVRYSNTFRKKTVKFKAGEVTKVDMRKPDDTDRFEAIYVETPESVVDEIIRVAKVGKDDTLLDIGSGNGVVVIKAAKVGAKLGVGVDIHQWLVDESKRKAKEEGVADRCEFRVEDALKMKDVSQFSVVYMCLGEDLQARLIPLLKTLKKGSRVVTHTHLIEGWTPDQTTEVFVPAKDRKYQVYLFNIK